MSDEIAAEFIIDNESALEAEYSIEEEEPIQTEFQIYAGGAVWGSISGNIENQTDLNNILTSLNGQVETNTGAISLINSTLDGFGDIVTYNAANFADSAQGALADTALQPGDNISELNNNAGYITSSDLPTVNDGKLTIQINGDYLAEFTANQSGNTTANITVPDSATWGNITGDIADQTDLQNALNGKQDVISDLSDIRSDASEGASAYSTISGYGDIVTHDVSEFATASQGSLADTSLQPNDNITELVNNAGYITSASIPNNYVTTDTAQTISSSKAFSSPIVMSDNQGLASGTILSNAKVLQRTSSDNTLTLNNTGNKLRLLGSETRPKYSADGINYGDLALYSDVNAINNLIPNTASVSNQLTDKQYVDDAISTNTADFDGSWATYSAVPNTVSGFTNEGLPEPSNNNYLVVLADETQDGGTWRYKYVDDGGVYDKANWNVEYEINETPLTQTQWDAINSGITSADVTLIGTALQPNDNVSDLVNDAGYITGITSSDVTTALGYTPYNSSNPDGYTTNVGTVTSVNNISPDGNGNVSITIPASQVNSDWNANSGVAEILNKPSLSTVATSGSYNDLTDKPTIPTVNNATLTIQKNGTTVNTFTANASTDVTANITVPTDTNDLTNGAGYITNSAISNFKEVFIAEYDLVTPANSTSYSDILSAYNSGKAIYCNVISSGKVVAIAYLNDINGNAQEFEFYTFAGVIQVLLEVDDTNTWTKTQTSLAKTSDLSGFESTTNKVTSISNTSTDTQYPSAKCVYTALSNVNKDTMRSTEFIVGTQASATGSWTGVTEDSLLYDGKNISYFLPYAGSGNATLNLTLSGGGTTGAKPVYLSGTTYITTHYGANSCINMTYNSSKGAWYVNADRDTNDTDRLKYGNTILAETAIHANKLICGSSDGYNDVASGITFDISYPVFYNTSDVEANATGSGNCWYIRPSVNLQNTKASWTGTNRSMVFLVGTLSGNTFTIDSDVFTTTVPSTEDGKVYMPIGILYSTHQIAFVSSKDLYAYTNGAFQPYEDKYKYDGQWVSTNVSLASGTNTPTTNDLSYDISSNLPNDSYNYEVLLSGYVYTAGTSGAKSVIAIETDIQTEGVYLFFALTPAAGSIRQGGSVILPVGSGRSIKVLKDSNNTGKFVLDIKGYRRIGTNT